MMVRPSKTKVERAELIKAEREAFLAAGGKIDRVDSGTRGKKPLEHTKFTEADFKNLPKELLDMLIK
jgi:hypothetical protein